MVEQVFRPALNSTEFHGPLGPEVRSTPTVKQLLVIGFFCLSHAKRTLGMKVSNEADLAATGRTFRQVVSSFGPLALGSQQTLKAGFHR